MKKNLLKSMLLTCATALTAVSASAQCYIIGNDNNWVTNKAGAELQPTATDNVYEGDVTFNGSYYFFITTKLMEGNTDWDGILPYRYNPGTREEVNIIYNTPSNISYASDGIDGSFRVADTGTHHIKVDFDEMTVTVDGTYPEHLYLLGSDGNWLTNSASATLDRVDGTDTYKANVDFAAKSYFAFFTSLSNDKDDWSINANRWAYDGEVAPNTLVNALNDENATSYIEREGSYEVTFNYTGKSYQLYDATYTPVEPEKAVYFVGNANDWHTNTCFAKLQESGDKDVYTGEVELSQYFTIATKLTTLPNDWTNFNANRWGPQEDGKTVTKNSTTDMYNYASAFQIDNDGKYNVTVDLGNKRLIVNEMVATGILSAKATVLTPQPYYDLTGRCLGTAKPAKGLYIKNGKKIVVE